MSSPTKEAVMMELVENFWQVSSTEERIVLLHNLFPNSSLEEVVKDSKYPFVVLPEGIRDAVTVWYFDVRATQGDL